MTTASTPTHVIDVFIHIPKTGGSTLKTILQRHYPEAARLNHQNTKPTIEEVLTSLPPPRLAALRLLSGHIDYGVHTLLPAPVRYFTMLRDPIDREISDYYHIKRSANHNLHRRMVDENWTIDDFVTHRASEQGLTSPQTRRLAGLTPQRGDLPDNTVEQIKTRLEDEFVATGLTERFDESVLLMQQVFGWKQVTYVPTNVAPERISVDELSASSRAMIAAMVGVDNDLYAFAQRLLDERIRAYGSARFEADLLSYRRANQTYKRIWQLQQAAKRLLGRGGA